MKTATLPVLRTSPNCISYRLTCDGRRVWSNRVYDRPEGHAGARRRLEAWAAAHQYTIVETERRRRA